MEAYSFIIGMVVLALGLPIGNYLREFTKDETQSGQKWFRLLILLSFIGALASLFLEEDPLLFTFLFISIVTSRNLKRKK